LFSGKEIRENLAQRRYYSMR